VRVRSVIPRAPPHAALAALQQDAPRMKTFVRTSAALLAALAGVAGAAPAQRLDYPVARTVEQQDDYHGTRVADPYRWLEDTESADTRAWITAENRVTDQYLGSIPQRAAIGARLTELWNFPR